MRHWSNLRNFVSKEDEVSEGSESDSEEVSTRGSKKYGKLNSKTSKVEVATCWNLSCSNSTVDKGYFGDPHLREIIFCDPNPDGSFYITDIPVLASD